jgi:hypothetical protein
MAQNNRRFAERCFLQARQLGDLEAIQELRQLTSHPNA